MDFGGVEVHYADLPPGTTTTMSTFADHVWVARDMANDDAVAVFSSDLRRASVTGRAIADALDLALIEEANLRERHLGDLQGLERASLATSVPSAFKVWKSRDRNAAVPGGGESSAGVDARLSAFFQTVSTGNYAGKKIIAVTHGGVLGRLFAGLPTHRSSPRLRDARCAAQGASALAAPAAIIASISASP